MFTAVHCNKYAKDGLAWKLLWKNMTVVPYHRLVYFPFSDVSIPIERNSLDKINRESELNVKQVLGTAIKVISIKNTCVV